MGKCRFCKKHIEGNSHREIVISGYEELSMDEFCDTDHLLLYLLQQKSKEYQHFALREACEEAFRIIHRLLKAGEE